MSLQEFYHKVMCKLGQHSGICVDGYYSCSWCSYKDKYTKLSEVPRRNDEK